MANVDAPKGFRAIRGDFRQHAYDLAAANAIIGKGDLLEQTAAGVVDRATAASVTIIGVALEDKDASSTDTTILVSDHPNTVYVAQTDNGTGVLTAQTGQNLNADFVVAAATNGVSRMEIDEGSGAGTATLPLKILRLHKSVDNAFGEFNRLECQINNHVLKSTGVAGA